MKSIFYIVAFVLLLALVIPSAQAEWVAYNDCVYQDTQFIAKNVTTLAIGRNNPYPESGNLLDQSNGKDTGVTITFSEFKTEGSLNWATDASTFDNGSDADNIFGEYVDPTGNISYGDAPGWYLDLIIENLDPDGLYTFAGTVNRNGGADYEDRVTNWTIMDADSFIYSSSKSAHKVSNDCVEFSTGVNTKGNVAQWKDIDPGKDGKIIIRTTHGQGVENGGIAGANANKGYAGGMFMLAYQGPQAISSNGKLATVWGKIRR